MSSSSTSSDSCHFSWLMKSCFPNPHNHHQPHPLSAAALRRQTTISSLPDDLLLECLSRVPHSSLPTLPFVCRRWSLLLDSNDFYSLRRHHNLLRPALFALSVNDQKSIITATLTFASDESWKVNCILPHDELFLSMFSHSRLVSIGRRIYVIGRTAMLRVDSWTGTVVSVPGPINPRKKFAAAAVAGKIYVTGGCSAVEEYDPVTERWRVATTAPRKRYGCVGAAVDGVFYVIGGLNIGGASGSRAAVYASSMDLYDVAAGQWLRSRTVPGGGCVVAAAAASAGFVYIVSSHAVELSFWRFNGDRKSNNFGEWRRLKAPPLPAQVRLDSTVRFGCVGVGDAVVLVQVTGCIDDLLRRSGRSERGLKEGLVLVYDSAAGEWSRGADLPAAIRRAACVSVEC